MSLNWDKERNMSKFKVLMISGDYYATQEMASVAEQALDADVFTCYRVYHIEAAINDLRPDVIVGNGKCKDRDPERGSYGVYLGCEEYSLIKRKKLRLIRVLSYRFAPLLIFRLWLFKALNARKLASKVAS
jgi:hypothetical protein